MLLINLLSEEMFRTNLKMKPHEKLLVNAIVEFMRKKFGITSKIIIKKKENDRLYGDVVLNDNSLNKNKFYLHFNPNQSYTLIIKSLLHELTHIKQISKGELKPTTDFKNLLWNGKHIITVKDYNNLSKNDVATYKKLPWEKEAYANMNKLYTPLLKSEQWKALHGKDDALDFILDNI